MEMYPSLTIILLEKPDEPQTVYLFLTLKQA